METSQLHEPKPGEKIPIARIQPHPLNPRERERIQRRNYMRKWRKENPEKARERYHRYYLEHRDEVKKRNHLYYLKHRTEFLTRARKQKEKEAGLRMEVLVHYSGYPPNCQCCHEPREQFLTIDHINGGGNDERRQYSNQSIYVLLKRWGFPTGYRVLCMNCNFALARCGFCPHQKENMRAVVPYAPDLGVSPLMNEAPARTRTNAHLKDENQRR